MAEETLPSGINAQELLLDLARGMDEDRRDSAAALEASFAEPASRGAGAGRPGESPEPRDCRRGASRRLRRGPGLGRERGPGDGDLARRRSSDGPRRPVPAPTRATPPPALESSCRAPAAGPAARPAVHRGPAGPRIRPPSLLVDDEEDVRRVLAERLRAAGYQVVEAEDPEAAVKKAGRLGKAGLASCWSPTWACRPRAAPPSRAASRW